MNTCQSCGAPNGIKCLHCTSFICPGCHLNHGSFCERLQAMRSRGLGPTIRTGNPLVKPALVPVEPVTVLVPVTTKELDPEAVPVVVMATITSEPDEELLEGADDYDADGNDINEVKTETGENHEHNTNV